MNILKISSLILVTSLLYSTGVLAGELGKTAGELDAQAMIQLYSNRLAEALRLERQAVQLTPDDPQLQIHLSNICEKNGDIKSAINEATRVVALDKHNWPLRRTLAALLQSDGRNPEAAFEWTGNQAV